MKKEEESSRDELSSLLADNLNKKFKSTHKVASSWMVGKDPDRLR